MKTFDRVGKEKVMSEGGITQEELDERYKSVGIHDLDDIYTGSVITWWLAGDGFMEIGVFNPQKSEYTSIKVYSWHNIQAASWSV